MAKPFACSHCGQEEARHTQVHVERIPAQRAPGWIDLHFRELRGGGVFQRRDCTNREGERIAVRQLEDHTPRAAVVARGQRTKPLFALAPLTRSGGADLRQNLGVAQSAFSHDTFASGVYRSEFIDCATGARWQFYDDLRALAERSKVPFVPAADSGARYLVDVVGELTPEWVARRWESPYPRVLQPFRLTAVQRSPSGACPRER